MSRSIKFIDEKLCLRILKDAYAMGIREVGFYLCGEPLLCNSLEKFVSYAKQTGYEYTFITTNGALLTKERLESLVDAGIDSIKFSINAIDRKSYHFIHGKDEFDVVINNLKNASDYRIRNNLNYRLLASCIVTKYTKEINKEISSIIGDYVDKIYIYDCINQGGNMYEIVDLLTLDRTMTGLGVNDTKVGMCRMPFVSACVSVEGYLTGCCVDMQNYLVVADLNHEELKEAWNCSKMLDLREKLDKHKVDGIMCKRCMYNCNSEVAPLTDEVCTEVDFKLWDSSDGIKSRITEYQYLKCKEILC